MSDPNRDPYAEGADARLSGQSETDNPYDLDTDPDDHMSWNDGFASIDDEDE